MDKFVVAIDGPAGSGKSSISEIVSKKLGFTRVNTGAMYRCVAVYSLRNNVDLNNDLEIEKIFKNIKIELKPDKSVFLNGENVSELIRTPEIDRKVKVVATIQSVRSKMVDLMREVANGKDVIMEGRDIGTAVFPNANVKIYLDAEPEERARRRYKENCEKNIECTYEKILEDMIERDKSDLTKGGLKKAEDAILVDSTNLTIEEVVEEIEKIIKNKM